MLATAAALGGCGRKNALDPPPGAWVTPRGMPAAADAAPINAPPPAVSADPEPAVGPDGKPVASAGPNRTIPADWLLR